MGFEDPVSEGSSRFSPEPFRVRLASSPRTAVEAFGNRGVLLDHHGLVDLRDAGRFSLDQVQEIADHLIRPEDLKFLRDTGDPDAAKSYFSARSALAEQCIDSLALLIDQTAEAGTAPPRALLLLLTSPLYRRLFFVRSLFRIAGPDWTLPFLHLFARRLDKSAKRRRHVGKPERSTSPPPPDEPSPGGEEADDDESPVFGSTASEALKTEVLDNLPNDLARLFYLASLFDSTVEHYVDHSRAERFGVAATEKAALRAHQDVFRRLTEARLEELAKLLLAWADTETEGFETVTNEWRANRTHRLLAPPTAEQGEKQLFENNLKLAIDLVASRIRGKTKGRSPRGD